MNIAQKQQKISLEQKNEDIPIFVTHVNIRQSIMLLLGKLLAADIFFAFFIILFNSFFFSSYGEILSFKSGILIFIFLVIVKICSIAYILFEWLEEYYEIYPKEVIHKRGILFKKEQRYILKHIGSVKIQQGFLGRIFNFGTIKMYDWLLGKDTYLYLIHNPRKYHAILRNLLSESDKEKEVFRERLIETEPIDE